MSMWGQVCGSYLTAAQAVCLWRQRGGRSGNLLIKFRLQVWHLGLSNIKLLQGKDEVSSCAILEVITLTLVTCWKLFGWRRHAAITFVYQIVAIVIISETLLLYYLVYRLVLSFTTQFQNVAIVEATLKAWWSIGSMGEKNYKSKRFLMLRKGCKWTEFEASKPTHGDNRQKWKRVEISLWQKCGCYHCYQLLLIEATRNEILRHVHVQHIGHNMHERYALAYHYGCIWSLDKYFFIHWLHAIPSGDIAPVYTCHCIPQWDIHSFPTELCT